MLNPGLLTDSITFSRATRTQSDNGDLVSTWVQYLSTYAKVREKSGGYSFDTGSINSQTRISVVIRYRPDLSIVTGDRVNWRGFEWIVNNGPVVDHKRTQISLDAVLVVETSER